MPKKNKRIDEECVTLIFFSGDLLPACEPEAVFPDGARLMLSFWNSWKFDGSGGGRIATSLRVQRIEGTST